MPVTVVNNQHLQLTINHLYCCILLVFLLHIITLFFYAVFRAANGFLVWCVELIITFRFTAWLATITNERIKANPLYITGKQKLHYDVFFHTGHITTHSRDRRFSGTYNPR